MFNPIKPGEKLSDRHVELSRNVLVNVYLRQQGDEFRGLMDKHPVFAGAGDDGFGDQPFALGDNARCGIGLAVGEGDCLAG